ncbi:unnamed protein product [Acanthoscelides obtectus]|uniref:Uncharacterized protein n=1 Tax=Acanthoscelides obtectus TaxID=200917 RepID=A0A9P0Q927_ACAOB|nr:unnamed protein product [Acanthoscelides obtectus]CAK1663248.1 hypothetical protein AOBTE_LOCUS23570 [Acanthoscelides obtectus]
MFAKIINFNIVSLQYYYIITTAKVKFDFVYVVMSSNISISLSHLT